MKFSLKLLLIIGFIVPFSVFAQFKAEASDTIYKPIVITGSCKPGDLLNNEFGESFTAEYREYHPDKEILLKLEKRIYQCGIKVILGTWCRDSREQLPRFMKILDCLQYNTTLLELICVDKLKKADSLDISGLKIEKVPTFIFYFNGTEKGRIIETPVLTIEQDMNHILFDQ
jgi:hypothetical protein